MPIIRDLSCTYIRLVTQWEPKGQLISECPLLRCLKFSKKTTKKFDKFLESKKW